MAIDFTRVATDLLSQLGYGGLTIGLVLDSFGIPIPSEVLLMVGGALAAVGRFNPWAVFVLGVAGQVAGGLISYGIGRYGGYPLLERYGKYVLISDRDLRRAHEAFEQYGTWMSMLGRCVPVIRGVIGYPAGVARMNVGKFVIFTALGSAVWTGIFVYLGYVLGNHLEVVNQWVQPLSLLAMVGIVGLVAWHLREHWPKTWAWWRAKK